MQTITRKGRKFVLVPAEQWERLASGGVAMPPVPDADAAGNRPAVAFTRAVIARRIIRDRTAAGLSQAQLARRAARAAADGRATVSQPPAPKARKARAPRRPRRTTNPVR